MGFVVVEIVVIIALVLANGMFALVEVAVVASRKARLMQRAQMGNKGAIAALLLSENPNRFLSTVQIGISVISVLSGAYGGATLSVSLSGLLQSMAVSERVATPLAFGLVVAVITFLSLVVGELVPKRIALLHPERIAIAMSHPMQCLSRCASPLVTLLGYSSDLVIRLLRLSTPTEPPVTDHDIHSMMEEGTEAGVFAPVESDMVKRIFRLSDRTVSALMTQRSEVVWLDVNDSQDENYRKLAETVYSRVPVCRGDFDNVLGILHAKEFLNHWLWGEHPLLTLGLQPPVYVPTAFPALKLLGKLRESRTHIALVLDEYGAVQGLVTLNDILEAIVGDLPPVDPSDEPYAVQRADGSWLLDGMLPIDEFREMFELKPPDGDAVVNYQTLSGFLMDEMGRIPDVGDVHLVGDLRFEVVDKDGHRLDKILVSREPSVPPDAHPL